MTRETRLRKISLSLTAKQRSIVCISRQLRYDSFAEYGAAVCRNWGGEPTFAELCDEVADSIELPFYQRDEGASRACKAAVVSAQRDALFLVFLHQHLVAHAARDEERLVLLSELLDDKIALLAAASGKSSSTDGWIQSARVESLKETVTVLATVLYRHCRTVQILEMRYFDGKNILFNSSRELLKEIGDQIERFMVIRNTLWRDTPRLSNLGDLSAVRTRAELQAEALCTDLTDAATIDALAYLGDHAGAMSVARQAAKQSAEFEIRRIGARRKPERPTMRLRGFMLPQTNRLAWDCKSYNVVGFHQRRAVHSPDQTPVALLEAFKTHLKGAMVPGIEDAELGEIAAIVHLLSDADDDSEVFHASMVLLLSEMIGS